ncbi:MAG: 50S ribosomal protein L9 [Clostridiales Family XIII bacterium]|jgi:large subunit ribosomal protein L9|nr:50S ribosomal protein L9 [Clostridiales Family XIII bacterium]
MVVILAKDVQGLGKAGSVVKVKDGYARNMLIPRGMAAKATDGNIKSLEKQKKALDDKRRRELAAAGALAEKMGRLTVRISTKSGENGRLFGSITSKDIAAALKAQHGVDIDRRKLALEGPIKNIGEFKVEARIYPEVSASISLLIEAEA